MNKQDSHLYEFGPFRLDPRERILCHSGIPVSVPPMAFDTLVVLVERHGHLVLKDELLKILWPDSFVEEGNLTNNISILRKALGESASEHRYIETVPRRGYRFVATVEELSDQVVVKERTRSRVVIEEEEEISGLTQSADMAEAAATEKVRWRVKKKRPVQIMAACIISAGLAIMALFLVLASKPQQPAASAAIRSIAVLPFRPLASADRDEPFELGMADTLITKLSTVKKLIVRPTSAVRKYMGLDEDAIAAGRELNVDLVLDGGIQKSGDKIRITIRLVNVADGSPLWAYKCDEMCTDLFALQDTISEDVVQALMLKLTLGEKGLLAKRYTASPEAYQLFVQGRYFWNKRTNESLVKSIEYFQQGIEKDPNYALAYVGLADSYIVLGSWNSSAITPREALMRAKAAAKKALEIDNTLAEAHVSLADVGLLYEWDWDSIEREFKIAIDLNPYYATAHQWYGNYLAAMGRIDEAIAEIRLAQTLDPLSPMISSTLGSRLYLARRYDQAIEQFRKTLDRDPDFANAHAGLGKVFEQKAMYSEAVAEMKKALSLSEKNTVILAGLAHAYAVAGNPAEATKILGKLEKLSEHRYVSSYEIAVIYLGLGKKDQAFEWLEKAYDEHASQLIFLKTDPRLDSLRSDAKFLDLLQRMRLQ